MSAAKQLKDLLRAKDSPLSGLVRDAQQQHRLNKQFQALVDSPITEHVQVGGSENGKLTLVADNSVWGHRIRYLAPSLLEQLRKIEPGLTQISIVVRPTSSAPSPPAPTPPRRNLSASSASVLSEAADLSENDKLAAVLRRLSKRAIKPD